jgi:hypothetical protein
MRGKLVGIFNRRSNAHVDSAALESDRESTRNTSQVIAIFDFCGWSAPLLGKNQGRRFLLVQKESKHDAVEASQHGTVMSKQT